VLNPLILCSPITLVRIPQRLRIHPFTLHCSRPKLLFVGTMQILGRPSSLQLIFPLLLLFAFALDASAAQQPAEKKPEIASTPDKEKNPAQIELLETRYRFESNGDSRKEVHTLVHINSELGVRQFARLNFDYNRSFQSIEIPLVHVTHATGGTADILPSAITDNPNPAVIDAPAYQDIRVKSVRILGLEPGDDLEYRVITTTTHHPLAPDFWLDHSFDRTGVVSQEHFEIDLPAARQVQLRISPATPAASTDKLGDGESARVLYRWSKIKADPSDRTDSTNDTDVVLTTYGSWVALSEQLGKLLESSSEATKSIRGVALQLVASSQTDEGKLRALYHFVSTKIRTVDLPVGATGFWTHDPADILKAGYATSEDKFSLLSGLAWAINIESRIALFGSATKISDHLPTPSLLVNCAVLTTIPTPPHYEGHGKSTVCGHCGRDYWLVPSMEVAPFTAIPATLRGQEALIVNYMLDIRPFVMAPRELPFSSVQRVLVNAGLGEDGKLTAKVHYSLRGDNELLLRVAFHQAPKDKWKDLAQVLALSDGFRGQVTSVATSDPYATRAPFTIDYEITQPKFVDWSKKPVRIPALLPQLGLPDPPAKPNAGSSTSAIELGTPLEVETHMTLRLPPGTTPPLPPGTSVVRDYATFSSQYSVKALTVTASRHINFLSRQVPADRASDYLAFLHAVQNDETQDITLDSPDSPPAKPAKPTPTTSPKSASLTATSQSAPQP
jgi:hypothetical protein